MTCYTECINSFLTLTTHTQTTKHKPQGEKQFYTFTIKPIRKS